MGYCKNCKAELAEFLVGPKVGSWLMAGVVCYMGVYAYRSLQVHYAQSRWLTRWKFFSLMAVYLGLVMLVLIMIGLASIVSI